MSPLDHGAIEIEFVYFEVGGVNTMAGDTVRVFQRWRADTRCEERQVTAIVADGDVKAVKVVLRNRCQDQFPISGSRFSSLSQEES